MAHNIDQSTGRAAFVSFKEKPWHGLGEIWNEKFNLEQLKQNAPHIFPEIALGEHICRFDDGTEIVNPESFFTWRKDTKEILGTVGGRYTVVQNEEMYSIVDYFDDYYIETAGLLQSGKIAFIVINFDTKITIGKNDEVTLYLTGWNSHNGSLALQYSLTPIRIVCNNTLNAAINNLKWEHKIKHTENWRDKQKDAAEIIAMVRSGAVQLSEAYNAMAAKKMATDNQKLDYIANVFCSPKELKAIKEAGHPFGCISTRKYNTINEVYRYMHTGPGQDMMNTTPNYWGAYNGITGHFCNNVDYELPHDKMEAVLVKSAGTGYMEKAAQLALRPNNIVPLGNVNFAEN